MNFHLDIVSLTGNLFSGEVKSITIPTLEGQITVYARHMSLVAPLVVGEVLVTTSDETRIYSIGKGVFSIDNNNAKLLIEDVMSAEDISEEQAEAARKKAEELIAQGVKGEELITAKNMLRRSLLDLKVASKRRRKAPPIS